MLPTFKNSALLTQALTHRSYLNEHPEVEPADNERLEFLGDAVLDFVVANWLFRRHPDFNEGRLTSIRSALVRAVTNLDAGGNTALLDGVAAPMAALGAPTTSHVAPDFIAALRTMRPTVLFGAPGHIRFSFAVSMETLEKALERLGTVLRK